MWCAAEIDEAVEERVSLRLVSSPCSTASRGLAGPVLEHGDMSLMLNAASPEATSNRFKIVNMVVSQLVRHISCSGWP